MITSHTHCSVPCMFILNYILIIIQYQYTKSILTLFSGFILFPFMIYQLQFFYPVLH